MPPTACRRTGAAGKKAFEAWQAVVMALRLGQWKMRGKRIAGQSQNPDPFDDRDE
jgi:hypothetical protein